MSKQIASGTADHHVLALVSKTERGIQKSPVSWDEMRDSYRGTLQEGEVRLYLPGHGSSRKGKVFRAIERLAEAGLVSLYQSSFRVYVQTTPSGEAYLVSNPAGKATA